MWLDDLCLPFRGRACRHVPDGSTVDVLDPRFATAATDNRWNRAGESTLYLGSDHEVLAVEWARHFPRDVGVAIGHGSRLRRIFDMDVALDRVIDLRDRDVQSAISGDGATVDLLNKHTCRDTAHRVRTRTRAQALLVPSIGLLDRPDAWVLVLFVDKVPSYPSGAIGSVVPDGTFGFAG